MSGVDVLGSGARHGGTLSQLCRALPFLLSVGLAGCASIQNTPQQDEMWEIAHICEGTLYRVTRVDPDGRYQVQGASNVISFQPFFDCVQQERATRRKARLANAQPKDLVLRAYLTDKPPVPGAWSGYPPKVTAFKLDSPVTFFYGVYESGRQFQAKFKWFRPDGVLEWQTERALRDAAGTGTWTWYTQQFPPARVQRAGTWRLEFYIEGELVGAYEFVVS